MRFACCLRPVVLCSLLFLTIGFRAGMTAWPWLARSLRLLAWTRVVHDAFSIAVACIRVMFALQSIQPFIHSFIPFRLLTVGLIPSVCSRTRVRAATLPSCARSAVMPVSRPCRSRHSPAASACSRISSAGGTTPTRYVPQMDFDF